MPASERDKPGAGPGTTQQASGLSPSPVASADRDMPVSINKHANKKRLTLARRMRTISDASSDGSETSPPDSSAPEATQLFGEPLYRHLRKQLSPAQLYSIVGYILQQDGAHVEVNINYDKSGVDHGTVTSAGLSVSHAVSTTVARVFVCFSASHVS